MLHTVIDKEFRIEIPEEARGALKVGDELIIRHDPSGGLMMIPETRLEEILQRTSGIWRDRADLSQDGVEYVQQIRRGKRLRDLGIVSDGD